MKTNASCCGAPEIHPAGSLRYPGEESLRSSFFLHHEDERAEQRGGEEDADAL